MSMSGGSLAGHRAVVTGGAQGLGLAIARRCLRDGAHVSQWDVSAAAPDCAVSELRADEVAALAAWLAGPDYSFCTGAVFDISGGRSVY